MEKVQGEKIEIQLLKSSIKHDESPFLGQLIKK